MFGDVNQGVKRCPLHLGILDNAGLKPGTYTSRNHAGSLQSLVCRLNSPTLRASSAGTKRVASKQAWCWTLAHCSAELARMTAERASA
jgi:hypothetical protein